MGLSRLCLATSIYLLVLLLNSFYWHTDLKLKVGQVNAAFTVVFLVITPDNEMFALISVSDSASVEMTFSYFEICIESEYYDHTFKTKSCMFSVCKSGEECSKTITNNQNSVYWRCLDILILYHRAVYNIMNAKTE